MRETTSGGQAAARTKNLGGRPRNPERSSVVSAWVPEGVAKRLDQMASARGLSRSQYLARRIIHLTLRDVQ